MNINGNVATSAAEAVTALAEGDAAVLAAAEAETDDEEPEKAREGAIAMTTRANRQLRR